MHLLVNILENTALAEKIKDKTKKTKFQKKAREHKLNFPNIEKKVCASFLVLS